MNYDLLGDIIVALNSIDQAQSEFPRNSVEWHALGEIYKVLTGVDITPYHTAGSNLVAIDAPWRNRDIRVQP